MTLTMELTTCSHPSSLSAIACSLSIAGGGSCSLHKQIKNEYTCYTIVGTCTFNANQDSLVDEPSNDSESLEDEFIDVG